MKIRFIFPNYEKHVESHPELQSNAAGYLWGYVSFPGLGIPYLAAVTPRFHEVFFTDDQFEEIDFDEDIDLVAISTFTPQAARAYRIADEFRQRGTYVVMGGKHVTCVPDDTLNHADTIFIGEAESTWPAFLEDLSKGIPQKIYRADHIVDTTNLPLPKRTIVNESNYPLDTGTLIPVRGCNYKCSWCFLDTTEPMLKRKLRFFTGEYIESDIQASTHGLFYIPDNILIQAVPYGFLNDVFCRLGASGKEFMLAVNPITLEWRLKSHPDLVGLLRKANVKSIYLTINSYTTIFPSLVVAQYKERMFRNDGVIKCLQDEGFDIIPSFFLGDDSDREDLFDTVLDYIERLQFSEAEFTITTPYPGSVLFDRLKQERRLLHTDWRYYNSAHPMWYFSQKTCR